MTGLTKRQSEIMTFIQDFIKKHQYSPSYREIMEHFGFSSLGSVHKHVNVLKRKGVLTAETKASRSLAPVQENETGERQAEVELPFIGHVARGVAIETFPHTQTLAVPDFFVRVPDRTYVLRARGDEFRDELVADGDLLVIEARQDPYDGEIVIGYMGDQETFIYRYHPEGNTVRLESQNRMLEPIVLHADEVSIQGVVTGLLRMH